jgi:hypothetical protein
MKINITEMALRPILAKPAKFTALTMGEYP